MRFLHVDFSELRQEQHAIAVDWERLRNDLGRLDPNDHDARQALAERLRAHAARVARAEVRAALIKARSASVGQAAAGA